MKSKPASNPSDEIADSKTPEPSKKQPPRPKKIEYQGNRWSSLIVLVLIMVVGFVLSLTSHR